MADLVYTRVSTDEQSTQRQTYLLEEAGLVDGADGVRLFSDPATSSNWTSDSVWRRQQPFHVSVLAT